MKLRWLLMLVVAGLLAVPVGAEEPADTAATDGVKSEEMRAAPLPSLPLFMAAPNPTKAQAPWESAALFSPPAAVEPAAPPADPRSSSLGPSFTEVSNDKWNFVFAPYLFFGSINGDMGLGRANSVPINVGAGDVLAKFQFGFMGRLEARKGRWGGMFEIAYIKLGDHISSTGPLVGGERFADAQFEQTMLEGFLTYRVVGSDKTSVDLFGGARYWDMDIDLDIRGPVLTESLKRGERWADPVFGARVIHFISDRWFIPVRGDLGGFGGAGATSDFTWNIQAGIGFQANKHMATVIQYKALGVDFNNGKRGTRDFFAFDAVTHGPVLGMVLTF